MKRVFCLILVAVMSIAGVAGAVAEESSPITIQFWNSFTGADGDLLVQLVDRFNAENQWGITIEMDISSSFTEQLSSALAANEGPALVLFSTAFRFQYAVS